MTCRLCQRAWDACACVELGLLTPQQWGAREVLRLVIREADGALPESQAADLRAVLGL